jgi:hypothetical protein
LCPELEGRLELTSIDKVTNTISLAILNGPLKELKEKAAEEFVQARLGLPRGSGASPLASDLLLAPVVNAMSGFPGRVVVYADNFVLMAKTYNDVCKMFGTLKSLLEGHPAGPLSLIREWDSHKQGGRFNFLGYEYAIKEGSFDIQPTAENQAKFEREIEKLVARIAKPNLSVLELKQCINRARIYVRSWSRSFKDTNKAHDLEKKWEQVIKFAASNVNSQGT